MDHDEPEPHEGRRVKPWQWLVVAVAAMFAGGEANNVDIDMPDWLTAVILSVIGVGLLAWGFVGGGIVAYVLGGVALVFAVIAVVL
jgi:hypothetical protein